MNTFILEAVSRGVTVTFIPGNYESEIGIRLTKSTDIFRQSTALTLTPEFLNDSPISAELLCMKELDEVFPKNK